MDLTLGVYISVPFCKAKCTFCNFASDVFGGERLGRYVARVAEEIAVARMRAAKLGSELTQRVDTVYLGGGTPSLLEAGQVRRMFEALRGEFLVDADAEITLECAPGQLAESTLEEMLRQGVNRVSFGVQSFVDAESAAVGRLHTAQMCVEEIARIRRAGVEEMSLDLIAGLPHQTGESWERSVEGVLASGVPHASVYMLEVDEESRLGREMMAKGLRYGAGAVPTEDAAAEFYQLACERFEAAGLEQYEISNFAREGHASRHNLKYWRREGYVGFGLDAHSMLPTRECEVRVANTSVLEEYLGATGEFQMLQVREVEPVVDVIGREAAFEETLFLGLRMNAGVEVERLRVEFGAAMLGEAMKVVEELCGAGLMEVEDGWMRLTSRGRMVSNEVFSRLLLEVCV